jgi:hypothetical protein
MTKIFIPETKGKAHKSNVRGFWKSADGVIYYDYISVQQYREDTNAGGFVNHLEHLKKFYNQLAIFYVKDQRGHIYTTQTEDEELKKCERVEVKKDRAELRRKIKEFLNKYGGATVYTLPTAYLVETWHN